MIGFRLISALTFLAIIITLAEGKPPPPPDAPWAKFVSKPVYARSLGPPTMSGIGTIQIPYIPKPTMFPKFVDPRMMIAKKTDLLSNMFGGLGPVMGPFYGPSSPFGGYGSPTYSYPYPGGLYGSEDVGPDSVSDDAENSPASYGPGFTPKSKYYGTAEDSSAGAFKRGLFGPMGAKGSFGGPMGPKVPFGGPFASKMGSPFYGASGVSDSFEPEGSTFLRRGIAAPKGGFISPFSAETDSSGLKINSESTTDGMEGTATTQRPSPSYPIIPAIPGDIEKSVGKEAKESPLDKIFGSSTSKLSKRMIGGPVSAPKEYLPGMYGPMGPMGPYYGPPAFGFGPGAFMSKKSTFLDTLFKNLATSTPPSVTDIPGVTEKSTIVPPGFWFSETTIPNLESYDAKVGAFLEKLFDSLKLNASTTAEDSPVQSVAYEESISAGFPDGKTYAARSLPIDYSGSAAPMYFNAAPIKSVRSLADPEAVIVAKDQIVNSIITELGVLKDDMISTFNEFVAYQKNMSLSTMGPGSKPFKPYAPPFWGAAAAAATANDVGILPYKQRMIILNQVFEMLMELQTNVSSAVNDAVKSTYAEFIPEITTTVTPDIMTLNVSVLDEILAKLNTLNTIALTQAPTKGFPSKFSRALPASPSSFWVAYPGEASARRNLMENQEIPQNDGHNFDKENEKDSRAIRMQMHQGYQSLPPGTVESIQAGGGSAPGHEGGGVRLLGKEDYKNYKQWQDWSKAMESEYRNSRRHHHERH